MAKKQEIATQAAAGPLARPDFIPVGTAGREHFTKDDIKLARVAIAQAMSYEVKPKDPRYIPDLKLGDMFDSSSQKILGPGPISFAVLISDKPRYIEFNDREAGGGIKDFDVKPGDPRTQFTTDKDGNRVKPVATMFRDYVIVILDGGGFGPLGDNLTPDNVMPRVIGLSMKNSQLKVAKNQLNTYISQRNADIWAGKYALTVVDETGPKGDFYNFHIENDEWVTATQFAAFKILHESLKKANVSIDRDTEGGDEAGDGKVPF